MSAASAAGCRRPRRHTAGLVACARSTGSRIPADARQSQVHSITMFVESSPGLQIGVMKNTTGSGIRFVRQGIQKVHPVRGKRHCRSQTHLEVLPGGLRGQLIEVNVLHIAQPGAELRVLCKIVVLADGRHLGQQPQQGVEHSALERPFALFDV